MTVFTVSVADEKAERIKKILIEEDVTIIDEDKTTSMINGDIQKPESALERIKKIQQRIGDQQLFKEITDPSEWQREIRKEWDRDF